MAELREQRKRLAEETLQCIEDEKRARQIATLLDALSRR
jgi:hypothetical protein